MERGVGTRPHRVDEIEGRLKTIELLSGDTAGGWVENVGNGVSGLLARFLGEDLAGISQSGRGGDVLRCNVVHGEVKAGAPLGDRQRESDDGPDDRRGQDQPLARGTPGTLESLAKGGPDAGQLIH